MKRKFDNRVLLTWDHLTLGSVLRLKECVMDA